jgi:hypothetical protein
MDLCFFVSFAVIAHCTLVGTGYRLYGIVIHLLWPHWHYCTHFYPTMNMNMNMNKNHSVLKSNKNAVNHNVGAPPQPQNEAIVDKLHGALNVLRRERDENHRRKDLAVERCRLMTEEKESMAKNAATMKERLETIQGSLATTKRDLAPRETSVQNLSKQVRTRMEWQLYYECSTNIVFSFYPLF